MYARSSAFHIQWLLSNSSYNAREGMHFLISRRGVKARCAQTTADATRSGPCASPPPLRSIPRRGAAGHEQSPRCSHRVSGSEKTWLSSAQETVPGTPWFPSSVPKVTKEKSGDCLAKESGIRGLPKNSPEHLKSTEWRCWVFGERWGEV